MEITEIKQTPSLIHICEKYNISVNLMNKEYIHIFFISTEFNSIVYDVNNDEFMFDFDLSEDSALIFEDLETYLPTHMIDLISNNIDLYLEYHRHSIITNQLYDNYNDNSKSIVGFKKCLLEVANTNLYTEITKLVGITKTVHGEDNVFYGNITKSSFDIYILFPEIEITNTIGHSHIIKDLVVRLAFNFNTSTNRVYLARTIEGTRLTVNNAEYSRGYAHSHLPTCREDFRLSYFCLGSTEIAVANRDLMVIDRFTEQGYTLFMYMLTEYVKHESLEGGPYIRIESINDIRGGRYSVSAVRANILLKNFMSTNFNLRHDTTLKIVPTEGFSTDLQEYITEVGAEFGEHINDYLAYVVDGVDYSNLREASVYDESSITIHNNSSDSGVFSYDTFLEEIGKTVKIENTVFKPDISPTIANTVIDIAKTIIENKLNIFYKETLCKK